MNLTLTIISIISLSIWLFLLTFWGQFWRANQRLETETKPLETHPEICAIIPARNEAELLPITLPSLLKQKYLGKLSVILINDAFLEFPREYYPYLLLLKNQLLLFLFLGFTVSATL